MGVRALVGGGVRGHTSTTTHLHRLLKFSRPPHGERSALRGYSSGLTTAVNRLLSTAAATATAATAVVVAAATAAAAAGRAAAAAAGQSRPRCVIMLASLGRHPSSNLEMRERPRCIRQLLPVKTVKPTLGLSLPTSSTSTRTTSSRRSDSSSSKGGDGRSGCCTAPQRRQERCDQGARGARCGCGV